ncbi:hypothetical protein MSAN_01640300 [Mycena sanguinolenta]|uniref:Uncharacterized protein n=1 Tax=Mycena sanguinolenta TaxID=230812 RepID=A0A8H7CXA8_9AGAR|nr:hypothetical protein MSAN_01640300 [Mycena sanguinolenta]
MFSKVLAFGLGALAIVRAAPAFSFQTPMLLCDANFATSVSPTKSFSTIEPGVYRIYNEAYGLHDQLRSYRVDDPIFVARTREEPGPFGIWRVETSGNPDANEYTLTNVGLNAGAHADSQARKGDTFAIESAGQGNFVIKVPNDNKVWTVDTKLLKAPVYLKGEDGVATGWRFERL